MKMLTYTQTNAELWSCLEAESHVHIISMGKMLSTSKGTIHDCMFGAAST